jgi:hypothetical protein
VEDEDTVEVNEDLKIFGKGGMYNSVSIRGHKAMIEEHDEDGWQSHSIERVDYGRAEPVYTQDMLLR